VASELDDQSARAVCSSWVFWIRESDFWISEGAEGQSEQVQWNPQTDFRTFCLSERVCKIFMSTYC
jgi:hypothetical protein